jgi:hypothetical protein
MTGSVRLWASGFYYVAVKMNIQCPDPANMNFFLIYGQSLETGTRDELRQASRLNILHLRYA